MNAKELLIERLKSYGIGRRKLDEALFANDKPLPRLGIFDEDDENLCHEIIRSRCNIPGCRFTSDSLLEFENHYNSSHRYSCSQCKKVLPSPHLLDLHIQETHDSFFAVLAIRKPSYCCYIEECKDKFMSADERLEHCIKIHKLPKDFRFDQKPKITKPKKTYTKKNVKTDPDCSMEIDAEHKFTFSNSKHKTFVQYTGKKFTDNKNSVNVSCKEINMDHAMEDLKNSLPE